MSLWIVGIPGSDVLAFVIRVLAAPDYTAGGFPVDEEILNAGLDANIVNDSDHLEENHNPKNDVEE
jgi:hypothetical protein